MMSITMKISKRFHLCGLSVSVFLFNLALGTVVANAQTTPQNLNTVMTKAFGQERKTSSSSVEIDKPMTVPALRKSSVATRKQGTMYLTPGKSQIMPLADDGVSVVIGNSNYINVFLDTPRTAVIVPRAIGTTEFSIIGVSGQVVAHSRVMVSTETDDNFVRIHRICAEGAGACAEETVYYCEDNCVEITPQQASASGSE